MSLFPESQGDEMRIWFPLDMIKLSYNSKKKPSRESQGKKWRFKLKIQYGTVKKAKGNFI